jgi:hypothetical protein
MRGGFRGMFRFGCSSAYGPHSYSVAQPKQTGLTGADNVEFRSYLYTLISQASDARKPDRKRFVAQVNEIFPGIMMGPDCLDLSIIFIAFTVLLSVVIGACFILGWWVDVQFRSARLQCAQQYAVSHPSVVAQFGTPRQISVVPFSFATMDPLSSNNRNATYTSR